VTVLLPLAGRYSGDPSWLPQFQYCGYCGQPLGKRRLRFNGLSSPQGPVAESQLDIAV